MRAGRGVPEGREGRGGARGAGRDKWAGRSVPVGAGREDGSGGRAWREGLVRRGVPGGAG